MWVCWVDVGTSHVREANDVAELEDDDIAVIFRKNHLT
jgi:hypothetical protein